jgi:regulator of sirC expression with transglutaminase-like and TPR domain
MTTRTLAEQLLDAADRPGPDLAAPAFLIARVEYPRLDPEPYLDRLEAMGDEASVRIASDPGHDAPLEARIDGLNRYLFRELTFKGNRDQYEDPRNSCLNDVLDRRTGIPISLCLVYIEVARRAGIRAEGVNFPGHFLVRARQDLHTDDPDDGIIIDPFHDGAILDEGDCRALLTRQTGDDSAWEPDLLARATRRQILVRMLLNLKLLYVKWRSFPQARLVTDLLLPLTPNPMAELRDRGLLAYHMNDFAAALRDLESYLRGSKMQGETGDDQREEDSRVWEHVKALRRRVAGLN